MASSNDLSSAKSMWPNPRNIPVLLFRANLMEVMLHTSRKSLMPSSVTSHERLPMYADKHPSSFLGSSRNSLFLFLLGSSLHCSTLINLLPLTCRTIKEACVKQIGKLEKLNHMVRTEEQWLTFLYHQDRGHFLQSLQSVIHDTTNKKFISFILKKNTTLIMRESSINSSFWGSSL